MHQLSSSYKDLLYRYARRLVSHKLIAIIIVDEVKQVYQQKADELKPAEVRHFLKTATLERCQMWMEAKNNVLTAREPKDPT